MRKIFYLCGMMLLCMDMMAQSKYQMEHDTSMYCHGKHYKHLNLKYESSIHSITPGWRYDSLFSDEFNDPILDLNKWMVKDRIWHSPKKHVGYINSRNNVHIEDGKLYMTVTSNDDSIVCCCDWDTTNLKYHAPELLSGWVESKKHIRYGYIETKCYLPKSHLYWPCLWTTGRDSAIDDYDEVDVFERTSDEGTNYPNIIRQNCYNGSGTSHPSFLSSILTFSNIDSITGKTVIFGAEILPKEVVFYINGHVTGHFKYDWDLANDWNIYTCTDIEQMIRMKLIFSLTCEHRQITPPLPQESTWFEYIRCYKLERGIEDTFHPSVFVPSDESTKVYPHVILGGIGCTANINTSTAVWAEQDIILDKGFELSPNTAFSARVISVPCTDQSEFYINH